MKYVFVVMLIVLYICIGLAAFCKAAPSTEWFAGDMPWAEWATMTEHAKHDMAQHYVERYYEYDKDCNLASVLVYQELDRALFYVKCQASDRDYWKIKYHYAEDNHVRLY